MRNKTTFMDEPKAKPSKKTYHAEEGVKSASSRPRAMMDNGVGGLIKSQFTANSGRPNPYESNTSQSSALNQRPNQRKIKQVPNDSKRNVGLDGPAAWENVFDEKRNDSLDVRNKRPKSTRPH